MKKEINKLTPFAIILILVFSGGRIFSQPWMENVRDPENATLYELKEAFNNYWTGRIVPKGKGYKQFKRWENFMELRAYPTGKIENPAILWQEYQKIKNRGGSRASSWVFLGPSQVPSNGGGAGRINCIRFTPGNSNIVWVGAPAGGLWKSTNSGLSWSSNTDFLPNLGVSDLAIDPVNTNIMYLATGDGDGSDTYTTGLLKSIDGGLTWDSTGLMWTVNLKRTVRRVLVNPDSTNILIAATSNGLMRSLDAGASWTIVRSGSYRDLEFKPGDPDVVYACTGTQIFRSDNGGATWTSALSTGLPSSSLIRRIQLAVSPSAPDYVGALMANQSDGFLGFYTSSNNGDNWSVKATSPNLLDWSCDGADPGGQGWYDLSLAVSPADTDIVFVGGVNGWKSNDGGSSWFIISHWYGGCGVANVHADVHAMEFDPNNASIIYSGNDGGLFRSTNEGSTWANRSNGLQIHQFYKISNSYTNASLVMGGAQDNGTDLKSGNSWERVIGGDGMQCIIDYQDENILYGSLYYGDIRKSDDGGNNFYDAAPLGEQGAWITPYIMDPHDHNTLYAGYQDVFKTEDGGASWFQISTSLTNGNDLNHLAMSPADVLTIYAARNSQIFKTTNGGTSWTNITAGLPASSFGISSIAVDDTSANVLWVTLSGYSPTNKVFKSVNGGLNWINITKTGLPNVPANIVANQKNVPSDQFINELYVGTDLGVFYTNDSLPEWEPFNTNLPNVIISDLEIHYPSGKIRAGTYGRGLWESPLFSPDSVIPGFGNDISRNAGINVFPNPTRGMVHVEFSDNLENAKVDVIDIVGRVVASADHHENSKKVNIDISAQPKGIYFVKVVSDSVSIIKKISLID